MRIGNVKIGYVGAYNYAEVISGYTAFFLGVRSHRSERDHGGHVYQLLV